MTYSRKPAARLLGVLSALLLLTSVSGCQTFKPQSKPTAPPLIQCEERAPAEDTPTVDAASTDWRYWYGKWLEAIGQKTAEVQKRVTTAECLDELRRKGVIR